ncbi:hypothetical protein FACS1894120_5600 [Clostridia bacterium]|nr:hypothetical protein FACS1894120_5600 [Clostridia bacterium]
MAFCSTCGQNIGDGVSYCQKCGRANMKQAATLAGKLQVLGLEVTGVTVESGDFCVICGNKHTGIYCGKCGKSRDTLTVTNDGSVNIGDFGDLLGTAKQLGSNLGSKLSKDGAVETLKNLSSRTNVSEADITNFAKTGVRFALVFAIVSIVLSVIFNVTMMTVALDYAGVDVSGLHNAISSTSSTERKYAAKGLEYAAKGLEYEAQRLGYNGVADVLLHAVTLYSNVLNGASTDVKFSTEFSSDYYGFGRDVTARVSSSMMMKSILLWAGNLLSLAIAWAVCKKHILQADSLYGVNNVTSSFMRILFSSLSVGVLGVISALCSHKTFSSNSNLLSFFGKSLLDNSSSVKIGSNMFSSFFVLFSISFVFLTILRFWSKERSFTDTSSWIGNAVTAGLTPGVYAMTAGFIFAAIATLVFFTHASDAMETWQAAVTSLIPAALSTVIPALLLGGHVSGTGSFADRQVKASYSFSSMNFSVNGDPVPLGAVNKHLNFGFLFGLLAFLFLVFLFVVQYSRLAKIYSGKDYWKAAAVSFVTHLFMLAAVCSVLVLAFNGGVTLPGQKLNLGSKVTAAPGFLSVVLPAVICVVIGFKNDLRVNDVNIWDTAIKYRKRVAAGLALIVFIVGAVNLSGNIKKLTDGDDYELVYAVSEPLSMIKEKLSSAFDDFDIESYFAGKSGYNRNSDSYGWG